LVRHTIIRRCERADDPGGYIGLDRLLQGGIQTIDCLIAQTALENDLLLLHNDGDFDAMSRVIALRFPAFD